MLERKRPRGNISPLWAAVIAASAGVLGTLIGGFIQGRSNLELEQKKFESALILKAIETGDPDKATVNLLFLIKAGFIKDPNGRIAELARKPETVPVLPQTGPPQLRLIPNVVGRTLEDATARIRAGGLLLVIVREPSDQAEGTVIAQSLQAGTLAPQNTVIALTVAVRVKSR